MKSEPTWLCEYHFEGNEYELPIAAPDAATASRRLRAIGTTGTVKGEVSMIITFPLPKWLARLLLKWWPR